MACVLDPRRADGLHPAIAARPHQLEARVWRRAGELALVPRISRQEPPSRPGPRERDDDTHSHDGGRGKVGSGCSREDGMWWLGGEKSGVEGTSSAGWLFDIRGTGQGEVRPTHDRSPQRFEKQGTDSKTTSAEKAGTPPDQGRPSEGLLLTTEDRCPVHSLPSQALKSKVTRSQMHRQS